MGNVVLFTCCEVEFSCHDISCFSLYCSNSKTAACESFGSLVARVKYACGIASLHGLCNAATRWREVVVSTYAMVEESQQRTKNRSLK